MITKDFYNRSVKCTCFLNELKIFFEANDKITNAHFIPAAKGYEVEYINNRVPEKLCINIRNRFYNGLIIKKYADGKFKKIYFAKDGFTQMASKIFQK